uniref:SCP domain-containing protein n=1 Tax=Neogobius melanostomus TaxID=47308 RepID=A0A8C6TDG2_9GOBI
ENWMFQSMELHSVCRALMSFSRCLPTVTWLLSIFPDLCTTDTQVQDEIVNLHNDLRRSVNPPAQDMLQMEIATALQTWVDGCSLAHGLPSSPGGEPLLCFFSKTWTTVIKAWYDEVENYKYPNGSTNGKEVGHYTQVIWNSSYRVGCAMAMCPQDNVYFYACRYFRAGNVRTWPPYTEGPWCGLCPDNCHDKLCNYLETRLISRGRLGDISVTTGDSSLQLVSRPFVCAQ